MSYSIINKYESREKMKFIKNKQYKLLILLLILISIVLKISNESLFQIRFSLDKKTLSISIAIISLIISTLLLIPKKGTIINLINQYKDVSFLIIYVLILEMIFVIENNLDYTFLFIFSIFLSVSIISLIGFLLSSKWRRLYIYIIITFLPVYLIGQDVYLYLFSEFFSVSEAVSIKEGAEFAGGVFYFRLIYIIYTLILIGSIILFSKIKSSPKPKLSYKMFSIPLILFVLTQLNAQYPVKEARLHTSDHYLYSSVYNNKKFVSRFGIVNYLVRDITRVIEHNVTMTPVKKYVEEIDYFFEQNKKLHQTNEYTDIFKDKNLIFVVAESFDYIALDESLTPNIYKLMTEGLNFDNFYVPVFPRTTCDTEIIFNTGIIPSITNAPTCYTYNRNSYTHSLASLFNQKGYKTRAFHSNDKNFYTRDLVYEGFDYDNFYGQHELGLTDVEKRFDSIFYEKAKDYIAPIDTKFFSFVLTLSGHSPYNSTNLAVSEYYDVIDEHYKGSLPEEITAYIAAQIEIDKFIGTLITDLETKDIIDDTIIIFTADHYPYTLNKKVYEDYTAINDNYLKNRSPFIIWSNQMAPKIINKVGQSADILPTIANMFNLNIDYTYYFGNDILAQDFSPLVYYKDYSWYDGDNYVLFGEKITGNGDDHYIKEMTKKVDSYFDISEKIFKVDYFKNK